MLAEITPGGETTTYRVLDPETFLVVRLRKEVALPPGVDPTEQLLESSDFRETEGVVRSFRGKTVDMRTGTLEQESWVPAIEINPEIDSTTFAMPGGER